MEQILETPTCSLKVERRSSYLYALASGKRESKETCKQIWTHILTESKLNQYDKILFERKIEGIGNFADIREMISELADHIDNKYIALLDNTPEHFQTNRLVEISASNLGLNVKFCTSAGEAKEWLLLN